MMEWIRFILAAIFILTGVFCVVTATFGVYKFKFVLNRMHAAAVGDTLGLFCIILGLVILSGFNFVSLKLVLVLVFFWMTGPISSHFICRMEISTDKGLKEHCEVAEK